MTKKDLVETEEYQAWKNGLYGHFEKALHDSLVARKKEFSIWKAPDIYFLTLSDSILLEYAPFDTRAKLEQKHGTLGLFLNAEKRAILGYRSEVVNSLVLKRMMEWHRISIWSCMAAYHSSYESVARELRFLVEDSVQALRADQKKPSATIDEKIEWLESIHPPLRGRQLIDATDLVLNMGLKLKDVYNELCDFVHPSVELIKRDIENQKVYYDYNEWFFDKMFELHTRVFDLVLALVVHRFPKAIDSFLEYQGLEELEKDGYRNTIAIIEYYDKQEKRES